MGKMMSEEIVEIREEAEDEVLPGFRFHPTDEELVGFYLRRKVETKKPFSKDIIKQLDIYKYNPWDLPKEACTVGGQEKEWYFFCLRGRKYRNSVRPNRVTGSGFWKATGIDRPIYSPGGSGGFGSDEGVCIGLKKSLVYYRGSAGKGNKTNWMMHEYRLPAAVNNHNQPPEAEIWTICRIFEKNISFMKKYTQNRKQSTTNQVPTDQSSSKSSSFESDTNYYEARNYQQLLPTVQAPTPAALHPSVVLPQSADTDDNWDELGRMTDFLVDTSPGSECTYYW